MNITLRRITTIATRIGATVWRHSSAVVALLLIVMAFVIGHRLGQPSVDPDATAVPDHSHAGADDDRPSAAPQLYTCSMHPAVRLPDPNAKCPICFMDLIPVGADEGEGSERRVSMSAEAAALSRIETARAARLFPEAEVRLYGTITYDETAISRLTAYAPGRIERLFVNFLGVRVQAGDHLAALYSPELLASFEELRQARAAVDSAVNSGSGSELVARTTRDTLVAVRERLRLLGVTTAQIAAIEDGSFEGDRLTIFAPLGGVVTELAVREGDYVQTGDRLATVADLSRLWVDLAAYESQLPLLRWGLPVDFTVSALPGDRFSGRIAFIEPIIDAQTRAATVRVAVDNPEGRLKPGMFATAIARPRIDERGVVVGDELAGRWVSPMHPTIVKDEPGTCDICGMDLVTAESLGVVGDPASAIEPIVVPRSAVLYTGRRSIVYVLDADAERPTYESREVTLGPRAGELQVIRDGLREGEQVVVRGAFRIDSAMQIAAKPSMMSMEEGSEPVRHRVPDRFLHALKPVYAAYFDAQEALADDDLDRFRVAIGDLETALGFVDETGVVGTALGDWRRALGSLRGVDVSGTIDDARIAFERMSSAIIALLRRFGHDGVEAWHLAHCPMAFDDRGADWIQRGTRIANPYFGAEMLRCGEIRASFAPRGTDDNDVDYDESSPRRRGVAPLGGHRHE